MCPLYLVVENMSHFITGRKYVYFFIGRKSVRRKSVRRKSVRRKSVRRKNVPVPCNVLARTVILQGQLAGIEQKHLLVQLRTFSMFDK